MIATINNNCNCNVIVPKTSNVKYLRVYLDKTFNWNKKVKCSRDLSKTILKNQLNIKLFNIIYKALFKSALNYNTFFWENRTVIP